MSISIDANAKRFLGRRYDVCIDSWVFCDGSGRITNEARELVVQGRDNVPLLDIWKLLGHNKVLAAAREADKFLPGMDLWALIDPQGRVYRGTAEELFPVLAAAHPLLKTRNPEASGA